MPDRKKTPDVMGDLLGERPAQPAPRPQKTDGASDAPAPKPPPQKSAPEEESDTTSPATPEPPEPERTKATYYIDTDALDRLEMAWFKLRQQVPSDDRRHVSKSLIVETALTLALDELESSGSSSPLARIVLNH